MREFFGKNKIFFGIIIGALIIGGVIYVIFKPPSPISVSECLAPPEVLVTKVIDGDTVIVEGGYHVRLLGIDSDESGYPCYQAAKSRLEELVLNKEVRLEKDQTDIDQYKRCLRYVFLNNQNINLQLIKEGLAIARFYASDVKYKDEIVAAEKEAIENKIGCKWGGAEPPPSPTPGKFKELTTEKTGLEVVFACNAGNYYGQELIVEGKIASTYRSKTNTVFLNFEKAYPNQCFTSVIFSSDQYKFVEYPEKYYADNIVRVKGEIKEYRGKPEIILKDPSQIEVGK